MARTLTATRTLTGHDTATGLGVTIHPGTRYQVAEQYPLERVFHLIVDGRRVEVPAHQFR